MDRRLSRRDRRAGGVVLVLLLFLAAIVLAAAGYLVFVFNWSYSEGDRSGILQKFSRKGWLCKTWEGELAMTTVPGVAPEMWRFTVRDDAVAAEVAQAIGKRVALHYREHRGVPTSCFGETGHWVDGVKVEPPTHLVTPLPVQ